MNGRYSQKNSLGQLAIVLHAHLPYVRKNEKNSLEEDWLFQAILECYIPLLQSIESCKKENPLNTKLTISLSPTLLSLLDNKKGFNHKRILQKSKYFIFFFRILINII